MVFAPNMTKVTDKHICFSQRTFFLSLQNP
jgi:hypothetical protein